MENNSSAKSSHVPPISTEDTTTEVPDASASDMPSPSLCKSDGLNKCLVIIKRAKTDTEKFAALLMVTKLVKAEELIESDRKKLVDAIGLVLLSRMIKSNEMPPGCPPFMYKSIAVTIVSCFASVCHGNASLYNLIPDLTDVISNVETYEENLTLVKECFECLEIIASESQGRKAIINYEGIGALVECYINQNYGCNEALKILRLLMKDKGPKMWEDEPEAFEKLISSVVLDFSTEKSELKFELCDVLIDILHSLPEMTYEKSKNWKESLHKGVCDIIFSKLGKDQREKGLHLSSVILETLGVVWVVNTGEKGRQLLLLMVHLACIEVRMCLEEKSFQQAVEMAISTIACYSIIENAIKFLINGAIELEVKQKEQLYIALKGSFNAVLLFLKEVFSEQPESNNTQIQMFVCATIRVLGAWLAEETAANKEEVYEILPFIIKSAQFNFEYNSKIDKSIRKSIKSQHNSPNPEKMPDLLRFLLPGLCHLTAEDVPRYILLEYNIETTLFKYLNHNWDNVKNLFRPGEVEEEDGDLDNDKLSTDAIISICNIFMNIVVQEPDKVRMNDFYYTLLKFVFNRVPNVPTNDSCLPLCGCMCTLGLMILRHQHLNVKQSDFTIIRFMQTAIRFLWDAHNAEESTDYATLVVSNKYAVIWDEVMELWFLGMHTVTILLTSIPWVCEFLMESEWPHTLVVTLLIVREGGLDSGLKSIFQDFLSTLIQSHKPSLNVLKEKGILTMAQNHKFDELLRVIHTCESNRLL